jgi:hypothetical protein
MVMASMVMVGSYSMTPQLPVSKRKIANANGKSDVAVSRRR